MASYIKGKNANKPHTIRYQFEGRQREKSFRTYREAMDFKAKYEYESREQIFVDPRAAAVTFQQAAERWVESLTGAPSTKVTYRRILKNHINPLIGNRSLRNVASDRFALEDLLKTTLPKRGLGASQVKTAYIVIRATVNDAIKAGKLSASRINGISLPQPSARANITFASYDQLTRMAKEMPDNYGLAIWLMRGCGLRIGEALAVRWENIKDGVLRITEQLNEDNTYGPLKHRAEGDFRDVPIPDYVMDKLAMHDYFTEPELGTRYGYVFQPTRRLFSRHFNTERDAVGLPKDFTPHTLRHIFASVSLSKGIPITDVSVWLGHRNINMTFAIYGHLVPSSVGRAREVLDSEYTEWQES